MDLCAEHRPYLGAIADGEVELVPGPTRRHVAGCPECTAELEAHRLLSVRLSAGLKAEPAAPPRRRVGLRVRAMAAAAGLAAAVGVGAAGWNALHRTGDVMGVAVAASQRAVQIRSADTSAIARWCSDSSNRRPPPVSVDSLVPEGARSDPGGGGEVVTIFYRTGAGGRVSVGWIDSELSPAIRGAVEARQEAGMTVLLVHAPAGSAVVSGDVPLAQLWHVADVLEATGT